MSTQAGEVSHNDDDVISCPCCGRSFPRILWCVWTIVPGRELDCHFCCLAHDDDD